MGTKNLYGHLGKKRELPPQIGEGRRDVWGGSRYGQGGVRLRKIKVEDTGRVRRLQSGICPAPTHPRFLPNSWSPGVKINSCNSLFSSETQTHTLLGRQLVLLIRGLPFSLHRAAQPQALPRPRPLRFPLWTGLPNACWLSHWQLSSQSPPHPCFGLIQIPQKRRRFGGMHVGVW